VQLYAKSQNTSNISFCVFENDDHYDMEWINTVLVVLL